MTRTVSLLTQVFIIPSLCLQMTVLPSIAQATLPPGPESDKENLVQSLLTATKQIPGFQFLSPNGEPIPITSMPRYLRDLISSASENKVTQVAFRAKGQMSSDEDKMDISLDVHVEYDPSDRSEPSDLSEKALPLTLRMNDSQDPRIGTSRSLTLFLDQEKAHENERALSESIESIVDQTLRLKKILGHSHSSLQTLIKRIAGLFTPIMPVIPSVHASNTRMADRIQAGIVLVTAMLGLLTLTKIPGRLKSLGLLTVLGLGISLSASPVPSIAADLDSYLIFQRGNEVFLECPEMSELQAATFYHEEKNIRYFLKETPDAKAWILAFHGNGNTACDNWPMVDPLLEIAPVNLAFIEYPGYAYGNDEVQKSFKFEEQALLKNALDAYDTVIPRENTLPVIVYGASLGTTFASYVASERSPQGLILQTPFHHLGEYIEEKFGLIAKLNRYHFPSNQWASETGDTEVLIIHGDTDEIIPLQSAKKLRESYPDPDRVTFIEIPGGTHNTLPFVEATQSPEVGEGDPFTYGEGSYVKRKAYWAPVSDFLQKLIE